MKKKIKYGLTLYIFVMIFLFIHGLLFFGIGSAIILSAMSKTGSFEAWFLLFPGIGLIGWVGALIALYLSLRRKKRIHWLLSSGQVLYADIYEIARNNSISINGSGAYVVLCRHIDPISGAMSQFKSRLFLSFPNGVKMDAKVPVYVNPEDKNEYFVDIDAAL